MTDRTRASSRPVVALFAGCLMAAASPAAAAGKAHRGPLPPPDPAAKCRALAGSSVPAASIGLPTSGASVQSAETAAAASGLPDFCRVIGKIAPANPSDLPITFEVNLPTNWNGKAVQFGGGGFNGVLITGLAGGPGAPDGPVPLARGYATFGSDSGHTGAGFDGRFALNVQAFANYAGEATKRTHDAALYLIKRFYRRGALRIYHIGGSKGGQEGLIAAQRYPADYDGVVAYYPAAQTIGLTVAWFNMWRAAYATPGAALNPARQALLKQAVLAACDTLDGAKDGLIANTAACRSTFAVNNLRCPRGEERGDVCFSDVQIDALQVAVSRTEFPFPVAHASTGAPGFPVYLGGDIAGTLFDPAGLDGEKTAYARFVNQVIPYFLAGDAAFPPARFNLRDFQAKAQRASELYDASSTDLNRFMAKGGKLIIVQGTTDMLVPERLTTEYVERLRARYGAKSAAFLRYYVQPGYGHGSGDFRMGWDSLSALDAWVERGRAPLAPVAVDTAPATKGRSLPLCEHPRYPRYAGSGDMTEAGSFRCVLPDETQPQGQDPRVRRRSP